MSNRCGLCNRVGHNKRTCPNANEYVPLTKARADMFRPGGGHKPTKAQADFHKKYLKLKVETDKINRNPINSAKDIKKYEKAMEDYVSARMKARSLSDRKE